MYDLQRKLRGAPSVGTLHLRRRELRCATVRETRAESLTAAALMKAAVAGTGAEWRHARTVVPTLTQRQLSKTGVTENSVMCPMEARSLSRIFQRPASGNGLRWSKSVGTTATSRCPATIDRDSQMAT